MAYASVKEPEVGVFEAVFLPDYDVVAQPAAVRWRQFRRKQEQQQRPVFGPRNAARDN